MKKKQKKFLEMLIELAHLCEFAKDLKLTIVPDLEEGQIAIYEWCGEPLMQGPENPYATDGTEFPKQLILLNTIDEVNAFFMGVELKEKFERLGKSLTAKSPEFIKYRVASIDENGEEILSDEKIVARP